MMKGRGMRQSSHPMKLGGMGMALLATSMVAGCDQASQGDEDKSVAGDIERAEFDTNQYGLPGVATCDTKGVGELCGRNPTDPGPGIGMDTSKGQVDPKHIAVIYMQFRDAGELVAKSAYFKRTHRGKGPKKDDALAKCAIDYLAGRSRNPKCEMHPTPGPIGNRLPSPIIENFEYTDFGTPQIIYVHVDNDNISFNDRTPVSFTKFGSDAVFDSQGNATSGKVKDPNYAFLDAEVRPLSGTKTEVLRMVNYFIGANGLPITKPEQETEHSINFNLWVCPKAKVGCAKTEDKKHLIPIAIDPDMGNGLGKEP